MLYSIYMLHPPAHPVTHRILGQDFLPAMLFPVSTIPPTLHTHSFSYQRHCWPLSVPYQRSILTHSPITGTVVPCQYHNTNAPYSLILLSPALLSPVSTIPQTFHTHPFSYHWHGCPMSLPYQRSILTHSPISGTAVPCQYHTNAPYSLILLSPALLSPVTTVSTLHNHSFSYHRHCCFLSVPYQRSIIIHSPITGSAVSCQYHTNAP